MTTTVLLFRTKTILELQWNEGPLNVVTLFFKAMMVEVLGDGIGKEGIGRRRDSEA